MAFRVGTGLATSPATEQQPAGARTATSKASKMKQRPPLFHSEGMDLRQGFHLGRPAPIGKGQAPRVFVAEKP
jgi:hypothetical protein